MSGKWRVGLDTQRGVFSLKMFKCIFPQSFQTCWLNGLLIHGNRGSPAFRQKAPVLCASSQRTHFHILPLALLRIPLLLFPDITPSSRARAGTGSEKPLPFPPLHQQSAVRKPQPYHLTCERGTGGSLGGFVPFVLQGEGSARRKEEKVKGQRLTPHSL